MAGFKTDVQWPNQDQQRWSEGLQTFLSHAPNGGRYDGAIISKTQTIATGGTWKNILSCTVEEDPYNAITTDGVQAKFTVPYEWLDQTTGANDSIWVECGVHYNWVANATGRRAMDYVINGSTRYPMGYDPVASSLQVNANASMLPVKLQPNDDVQLQVYQNSGGNLDVTVYCWFRRVGHHVP